VSHTPPPLPQLQRTWAAVAPPRKAVCPNAVITRLPTVIALAAALTPTTAGTSSRPTGLPCRCCGGGCVGEDGGQHTRLHTTCSSSSSSSSQTVQGCDKTHLYIHHVHSLVRCCCCLWVQQLCASCRQLRRLFPLVKLPMTLLRLCLQLGVVRDHVLRCTL
jgi:hypothetical protein